MQPQYHTKEINIDFLIPLNIQSIIRIFQLSLNCFILQLLSFLNQDQVRFHPLLLLVLTFSRYRTLSHTTLVNVFISDFLKRLVYRILYLSHLVMVVTTRDLYHKGIFFSFQLPSNLGGNTLAPDRYLSSLYIYSLSYLCLKKEKTTFSSLGMHHHNQVIKLGIHNRGAACLLWCSKLYSIPLLVFLPKWTLAFKPTFQVMEI